MKNLESCVKLQKEIPFECNSCSRIFGFLICEFSETENHINCSECNNPTENLKNFQTDYCKNCAFSKSDNIWCGVPVFDIESNGIWSYDLDCDSCQRFIGKLLGSNNHSSICKNCNMDYSKWKIKIVCKNCKNNIHGSLMI